MVHCHQISYEASNSTSRRIRGIRCVAFSFNREYNIIYLVYLIIAPVGISLFNKLQLYVCMFSTRRSHILPQETSNKRKTKPSYTIIESFLTNVTYKLALMLYTEALQYFSTILLKPLNAERTSK